MRTMPDHDVEYVDLPIYRDQLAAAMNSTPSDLDANRAGRLGANQLSNQKRAMARAVTISLGLALVGAACVAAAVAIGITSLIGFAALAVAACCAAWIGIGAWYNVPVWRDVNAGIVSMTQGFVKATESETDVQTGPGTRLPIWSYSWTVDDLQRFWVPGKAYAALTPARHRLYFLPLSRRIMAAEPIISGPRAEI